MMRPKRQRFSWRRLRQREARHGWDATMEAERLAAVVSTTIADVRQLEMTF